MFNDNVDKLLIPSQFGPSNGRLHVFRKGWMLDAVTAVWITATLQARVPAAVI